MPPRRHVKRDQAGRVRRRNRRRLIVERDLPAGKSESEIGRAKTERRIELDHGPIGLIGFSDHVRAAGQRGSIDPLNDFVIRVLRFQR